MIAAQVSSYPDAVRVDMGGSAPLRDVTPAAARKLARALTRQAYVAEQLAAAADPRNARVGNRHERLILDERVPA